MKVYNSNSVLIAEGYLVPNPNFIPKGEYKETELDCQKKQADMLITSIDGNFYEISLPKSTTLRQKINKDIQGYGRNVRSLHYTFLRFCHILVCLCLSSGGV